MWSRRILLFVIILLHYATRTWGDCVQRGKYYERFRNIGYGWRQYYHCSNMTRDQYKSYMDDNINNSTIGRLKLIQINLTTIDQQLFSHRNYSNVFNLTIQDCNVTTIENHSFDKLTNLHFLYIKENNMKHFNGDFIESFKNLDTLGLSDNNIHQFNIDCGNYTTQLDLSNNPIKNFYKSSFKNCEGLQKLFIQNSVDFDIVESGMFDIFNNLSTLNLTNTGINNFDANAFKGLSSLLSLDLHLNKISVFPCNAFEQQIKLNALNLSNNLIENISICTFQNLFALKTLHLQFNKISFLNDRTFSALGQLRYLDISHNKLSALSESLLHPLDRIIYLNISANYLTHLNPELLFSHLKVLKQIDLSGNQWSCQNLTLIRKYLRSRSISYESKIKNFNDDNVGGIQCTLDNITTNITEIINQSNESIKNYLNTQNKLVIEKILSNSNKHLEIQQHIYNILVTVLILIICYKICCFSLKIYKEKYAKSNPIQNGHSVRTELNLLHTGDSDSV